MSESSAIKTPDWQAVLKSDLFTFVCGSNDSDTQTFQVHSHLVAEASPALNALINNGTMTESISRSVKLPEVEPETFVLFSQWLYTGVYRLPDKTIPIVKIQTQSATATEGYCKQCGKFGLRAVNSFWPFCNGSCDSSFGLRRDNSQSWSTNAGILYFCIRCGKESICQLHESSRNRCSPCREQFSGKHHETKPEPPATTPQLGSYAVGGLPHAVFAARLSGEIPSIGLSDKLRCHAMLYCFAMQYLIGPLQDACIHMLHRDVNAFSIEADNVSEAVELIRYTYDNTNAEKTNGGALRDLVMDFVLARKDELSKFSEFEALLFEGGDFGLDFFRGIMKKSQSA